MWIVSLGVGSWLGLCIADSIHSSQLGVAVVNSLLKAGRTP